MCAFNQPTATMDHEQPASATAPPVFDTAPPAYDAQEKTNISMRVNLQHDKPQYSAGDPSFPHAPSSSQPDNTPAGVHYPPGPQTFYLPNQQPNNPPGLQPYYPPGQQVYYPSAAGSQQQP